MMSEPNQRSSREPPAPAEREAQLSHIGRLVLSISREYRNAVFELQELAKEAAERAAEPDRKTWKQVSASLRSLDRMVAGVLCFAGEVKLNRERTDLREVLRRAVAAEREGLESAGMRMELTLPSDSVPASVDASRIEAVVRGMLRNAAEAVSGARGRLRVAVVSGGDCRVLRIEDDGPGMPEVFRGRIFDPFFTTKPDRLGLGLAIARGIVTAHGGRLQVDRERGWTVFQVELPAELPPAEPRDEAVGSAPEPSYRVLLVDDDDAVRGTVKQFLERSGHEVQEAAGGRSAMACLESGSEPEVVVTDLKMSDGSGHWFLDQLGRHHPRLFRRTMVITGDPTHASDQWPALPHSCPVMRKPFDYDVLLANIKALALRD